MLQPSKARSGFGNGDRSIVIAESDDVTIQETIQDNMQDKCGHWRPDVYPLYWTPSKEGIFMRYSYEYKRKCIEMYREGRWPETPASIKDPKNFPGNSAGMRHRLYRDCAVEIIRTHLLRKEKLIPQRELIYTVVTKLTII